MTNSQTTVTMNATPPKTDGAYTYPTPRSGTISSVKPSSGKTTMTVRPSAEKSGKRK